MSKQEWKNTGTDLGHAFKTFGKTFVRSAQTTGNKVADWADGKPADAAQPESTVYSDGSWRQTGKELGGALAGVGKTLLHTVGFGESEQAATETSNTQSASNAQETNTDQVQ